jgi:hypothetical protein
VGGLLDDLNSRQNEARISRDRARSNSPAEVEPILSLVLRRGVLSIDP